MQKFFTILCSLFFLSSIGLLYAQPANDLCQNAIAFPALTTGIQSCINGTNNGANPEFPYPVQGACQPGGASQTPNPSADVWYTVVAVGNELIVNFTSTLTNANIAVYQGSCGALQGIGCYTSANGNVVGATFAPTAPGNTYYIQVAGATVTDTANFQLCVTSRTNPNICLSTTSMTVNPQPVNGGYNPGDTVTFCYSVIQYTQAGANWFHGISINISPGWIQPPINIVPAASCDGQGFWQWYNSVTSTATGQTAGPGFFYETPAGSPLGILDNNPGNNFGDNSSTCTWTFCWDLVVDTTQGASTDLSLAITHYGDGQTGSWSSFSCTQDPVFNFSLFSNPCPAPSWSATPACAGDSNGTATVLPNGTPPFQYLWASGDTTQTVTGLSPGPYNVTVSDSDSCVHQLTVIVPQAPAMTLVMDSTDANCGSASGSASVIVTGGTGQPANFNYAWNPGGFSGDSIGGLVPNTYTVTVTDSIGCRDSASTTVISSGSITASISSFGNVSCFGAGDGFAVADVAGGSTPYQYLWIPGGFTNDTAAGLGPGLYTVIIQDSSGCIDTTDVTITEPQVLNVTGSTTPATCPGGSDGTATMVPTGGTTPYSYLWTPSGQTSATATGLLAGPHMAIVTDDNNCQDSVLLQVQEPPAIVLSMSGTPESCAGFADGSASVIAQGGTGPYTYVWSNGGTSQTITGLAAGTYTVTVFDVNLCSQQGQVTLAAVPAPVADAGNNQSFCEGSGGTQLTGSATGGAGAPYYYSWGCVPGPCGLSNPNDQNPFVNPTGNTTYYLIVTDSRGCSSVADSVNVEVLPLPIINAGPDQTICSQPAPGVTLGPVTVGGAPGPYTYQWSPAAGLNNPNIASPFARPDTTTIYTLVVTSVGNGCESDPTTLDTNSTVIVTVAPLPVAEAGPDIDMCFGDTIRLQGFGQNSGPNYNFQWSPATSLSNASVQNPLAWPTLTTDFVLVVTSQGCESYGDTVTVTVHTNPTAAVQQASIDICYGDSTLLEGDASGGLAGTTYTYSWSPGSTLNDSTLQEPTAFPLVNTTYELVATSNFGCESPPVTVDVVIVPSPVAEAGAPIFWCEGQDSINLSGSVAGPNGEIIDPTTITWSWSPAGDLSNPGSPNTQGWPSQSGWYTLTTSVGTCSSSDSVLVNIIPEINAAVTVDTNLICENDSLQLNGSGGNGAAAFQWIPATGLSDPSVANPMAAPSDSTEYCLVVSQGGCHDTVCVDINVLPTPIPAYLNSQTDGCVDFTVSFTETSAGGVIFTWDFGDGTPVVNGGTVTHTYTQPGSYNVTLYTTGVGGCNASVSSSVVTVVDSAHAEFTSEPGFPVELFLPNTIVSFFDQSDNAVKWLWDFGDGGTSTEQNPVHQYLAAGEYEVTLTVENDLGCISTVKHGPYIINEPELFIPNVFTPNGDGNNDLFIVEYSGDQPFHLEIYDRWSTRVFETLDKTEGWNGTFNGTKAQPGVYFYTLFIGPRQFGGHITLIREGE